MKYRDNDLIELSKLPYEELQELYLNFIDHFNNEQEFDEFVTMQNRFYPRGVRFCQFIENLGNYSVLNAMNSLRKKLGPGIVKEHMTDSGDIFYSLGEVPDFKNER